jgi:hypothetical protein
MTMAHRNNPEAASLARARKLLDAVAVGIERLESAADLAYYRRAALAEVLARLEGGDGSRESEAGAAAALDGAAVCHEATVLLRYISSRQWPAGRVVANGIRPRRSPARTGNGTAAAPASSAT